MPSDAYPSRYTEPETISTVVTFTGTGATNPVKLVGHGVTVTWVSTGLYTLTFSDKEGTFIGIDAANFFATTMSALKGYDATLGAFDSTGKIVQVSVTNSSFALADLQVLQSLTLVLLFKRAQIAE